MTWTQSDSGPSNTRQYALKPVMRLRYQAEPLSRLIKKIGLRKLMRRGLGRRILQKIWRQEVKVSTLREYERNPAIHLTPSEEKAHL
jgi:hypothetical protein